MFSWYMRIYSYKKIINNGIYCPLYVCMYLMYLWRLFKFCMAIFIKIKKYAVVKSFYTRLFSMWHSSVNSIGCDVFGHHWYETWWELFAWQTMVNGSVMLCPYTAHIRYISTQPERTEINNKNLGWDSPTISL